jgi:hypothetical protein
VSAHQIEGLELGRALSVDGAGFAAHRWRRRSRTATIRQS